MINCAHMWKNKQQNNENISPSDNFSEMIYKNSPDFRSCRHPDITNHIQKNMC